MDATSISRERRVRYLCTAATLDPVPGISHHLRTAQKRKSSSGACDSRRHGLVTCVLPTSQLVGEFLTDSGGSKETHCGTSDVHLLPGTDPDGLPSPHLGHLSTSVVACHTS